MFRQFVIGLWLLAFPAVAFAETRVDFDRQKDFSRYKTFNLEIAAPIRADGVADEQNTLAESRLRQATTSEFQARGLEATDIAPDLTVRVSSRDVERTALLTSGWYGYPRFYRWRRFGDWGPYPGDVWTRRYLEGSVTLDVIERDTGDLIYRAQVSDEIGKDLDKQARKAVDKALKKFPVKEISSD